jgi:hypothetical protein
LISSEPIPAQAHPRSITLNLPPLATIILEPTS